jgi:hypothetical protein
MSTNKQLLKNILSTVFYIGKGCTVIPLYTFLKGLCYYQDLIFDYIVA